MQFLCACMTLLGYTCVRMFAEVRVIWKILSMYDNPVFYIFIQVDVCGRCSAPDNYIYFTYKTQCVNLSE